MSVISMRRLTLPVAIEHIDSQLETWYIPHRLNIDRPRTPHRQRRLAEQHDYGGGCRSDSTTLVRTIERRERVDHWGHSQVCVLGIVS